MKLIYKGKFNGDVNSIPHNEHLPNARKFNETASDMKRFGIMINSFSFLVTACLFGLFCYISGIKSFKIEASFLALFLLLPHEFLHAICFRDKVYLYTNFKNGLIFITGPETMSKKRAIFLNLLPNIVFGVLPFLFYLLNPQLTFLGSLGVFTLGMGTGDYYNVFNILKQMPKGSRTYLYGTDSYWYLP